MRKISEVYVDQNSKAFAKQNYFLILPVDINFYEQFFFFFKVLSCQMYYLNLSNKNWETSQFSLFYR